MITKELIWRFFHNDCTAEERELVARYLEENPGALEEFLSEGDWESYEASRKLDPSLSKRLFSGLEREYGQHRASRILLTRFAVAASVLLLAGISWLLLNRQAKTDIHAFAVKRGSPNAMDSLRHTWNLTAEKMSIALRDGSLIELYPGSEVSYREEMKSRREFHLQGKAYFKVASDINRPFVVYSDDLSTTVLGTSFTVTSFKEDSTIKVSLHTGKVLVGYRSTDNRPLKLLNAMKFLPGDLLVYDKKSRTAKLLSSRNRPGGRANSANGVSRPEWYMFSGQPLEQVFDQLSVYYGIEIGYSPSDIKNRYFTGRYENGDSLDEILKDIALLNRLTITKQDGRYIVKEKTPIVRF
jgi:ferric-dicitrate binding protein FerR (iron transport regulator)